jgi:plastocyanin
LCFISDEAFLEEIPPIPLEMIMKKMMLNCLVGLLVICQTAWAQDTATLKLKIVVDGKAPEPQEIKNIQDKICAEQKLVSDKILVNKDGGLANFALIFDEEKSTLKVPAAMQKSPEATHELDNNKCMFSPKVLIARPGQTIIVKNSDETGHNANFKMFKNKQQNFLIPAGEKREYKLQPDLVEPSAMPISCDVHSWMQAHVIVKPHPYVGVSNAEGVIEIKDLPVGEGAIFRIWHEATGGISELNVNGTATKIDRGNRWKLTLKPGVNDLGVVKLDAKMFK